MNHKIKQYTEKLFELLGLTALSLMQNESNWTAVAHLGGFTVFNDLKNFWETTMEHNTNKIFLKPTMTDSEMQPLLWYTSTGHSTPIFK